MDCLTGCQKSGTGTKDVLCRKDTAFLPNYLTNFQIAFTPHYFYIFSKFTY